jgi:cysteine-rich repeat protein
VELIDNGAFATNADGWKPQSGAIQLRTVNEGFPSPMALEVAFATAPQRSLSGAYQCIAVQAGTRYELRGQYRIPEGAPQGMATGVTGLLYAGTRCEGTYVGKAQAGPVVSVRNTWTPYQHVFDTSALGATGEGRLLVRLNAVRPANAQGTRVLWDTVSLSEVRERCGNCTIDSGETCDDGNSTAGDGCGATCRLEICGDGVRDAGEQCDDSNSVYGAEGDSCTPSCRTASACDECGKVQCAVEMSDCLGLEGAASAGPGMAKPRRLLCDRLQACVRETACAAIQRPDPTTSAVGVKNARIENCYCGSTGKECFAGGANGGCRAEIEAALETRDPVLILERLSGADPRYPVFAAARDLFVCELGRCGTDCNIPQVCGNGLVQDREYTGTFPIEGQQQQCRDEWTHTGRGCSFEECDDGNSVNGDGCDSICMVEACGNYQVQAGERCDDGNTDNGDGCSETCQPEYTCGNSSIEPPFEQCDPPRSGAGKICTTHEAEQHPAQCGCDSSCQLLVCGNGSVQAGEECDPPNGTRCGDDCKLIGLSPCEQCISTHPDLGPLNDMCLDDPKCLAVKECVLEAECFKPIASACYCGSAAEDLAACESPSFVPKGPCIQELRESLTVPGETVPNDELLRRFFAFEYPGGLGMSIVDEASRECDSQCFPSTNPPAGP